MGWAVFYLSLVALLAIITACGAACRIARLLKENKELTKHIHDLQYTVETLREAEVIKHENRKEAEKKLGGIDYGNIDTALSVLHDNAKND